MTKRRRNNTAVLMALIGAAAFCAGCAASPVERTMFVGQTYPLSPPDIKLAKLKGARLSLDLVHRNPNANLAHYACLSVAKPEWLAKKPEGVKQEELDKTLAHLQRRAYVYLASLQGFDLVTRKESLLAGTTVASKSCRLELAVTDMALGDPWVRYLVGMDQGAVVVQLEGRLVDTKTGDLLLAFADRRVDGGNPSFGINFKVFDGLYLVRKNLGIQSYWVGHLINHYKIQADKLAAASQPTPQPATALRRLYYIRR